MFWLLVCWEKFTRYFDVEERFVHLTNDTFVLTPEKAIELCDENTIGESSRPINSACASDKQVLCAHPKTGSC